MVNAVTVKKSYPILHMDECLDLLGEVRTFSMLDANLRNSPIKMDDLKKY